VSHIDQFHQGHTQTTLSLWSLYLPEKSVISVSTDSKQREQGYVGKQIFELSNHLGNVLATITDKKLQVSTNTISTAYFEADVQTVQDYYAFGMQMPGRKLSGGYRYGFNGKENDNEVKAEGNQQDYGMRMYDGRIGKFLSVDPLTKGYPMLTPYQFASNTPLQAIDLDGLEASYVNSNMTSNNVRLLFRLVNDTKFGKEFLTTLHTQNKVDVYYYTFKSVEMNSGGEIYDPSSFSEGFLKGGVKGQTNFVKNRVDLESAMKSDNLVSNVDIKDLEESFNKGKSVVLIGISESFVSKMDEIAKNQTENNNKRDLNWNVPQIRNLIIDAAHTLQHEQMAHALGYIRFNKDISDPISDHGLYNKEYSTLSPNTWKLIDDPKYQGSKAQKSLFQIIESMKRYVPLKLEESDTSKDKKTNK
jgi:RHS repeat-associated protein